MNGPTAADVRRCRLVIDGELSIGNIAATCDQLRLALAGNDEVEVNLSGVGELDTTGAQLLVAARKSAVAAGKVLRFADPSRPVIDTLDLFGLRDELLGHGEGDKP